MKSLHFEPYANYINPRIFIYLCAFTKALQTFILHTKDLELYVISQKIHVCTIFVQIMPISVVLGFHFFCQEG